MVMYTRILLPLDRSAVAEQALSHALAQARRSGAELILLRVLEPLTNVRGLSDRDLEEMRAFTLQRAQEYLDDLVARADCEGIAVRTDTVEGRPHEKILQYAEANGVDLIVICTRGRSGFSRWLMGSVADRVVRGAKVPVLLVRAQKEDARRTQD
jgi:nucleotide-binding universal stress UspA family protein